ncbi:MAG: alpha/beta hydrolase [Devosiaceae bacterium]|nr:alpha/beta hydrolase [Devosiaceae bacterium MH13]
MSADPVFPGFEAGSVQTDDVVSISYVTAGSGPALLLAHGYPQTKALWAKLAPALAQEFTVVAADLRGYGASSKPDPGDDGAPYAFRAMARDMARLMHALGHETFHYVGHDRGARAGHRLAKDSPERLLSLAVLDIVPTEAIWEQMGHQLAKSYWHWLLLSQPAAFAEALIGADPDFFFEHCLTSWGRAKLDQFEPAQLEAYRQAWRDPAMIAGSTADYRAAATLDRHDDAEDAATRIQCPLLVLYGGTGVMGELFDVEGVWRVEAAGPVTAKPMPGGHFFIDTHPKETLAELQRFHGSL